MFRIYYITHEQRRGFVIVADEKERDAVLAALHRQGLHRHTKVVQSHFCRIGTHNAPEL